MTQHPDLFAALAAPFHDTEVKQRSQAGRQFSYITARTAMNRFDDVLGPENWWAEYHPGEHSVFCRITIRLPDGTLLTKGDAGGYAGMADQGDDEKSGHSDSFKRAAVVFGVGRYLYRDGVPGFVAERYPQVDGQPDRGPSPGRQAGEQPRSQGQQPSQQNGNGGGNGHNGPPRSGKALFAWTKDQEQRYEVGLLKYLNGFMKLQDFPARMVDLDPEQVRLCYEEACRKLDSLQSSHADE